MKIFTFSKNKTGAVALMLTSVTLSAQNGLTNLSFETWTTTVLGDSPTGWFSSNVTQQTSGAQHGSKYARLNQSTNQSGFLFIGDPGEMGAPYATNPGSMSGFYKSANMQANDEMLIQAYTIKGGSIKAIASITVSTNVANWKAFGINFTTVSPGAPDTINIMVSNNPGNTLGSTFDVDNFSLNNGIVGISEKWIGTPFMVFPNPAKDKLNIISKNESATSIIITDMLGKKVGDYPLSDERTAIDLSGYNQGLYFYSIMNSEGTVLLSSKFVVE